MKDIIDERNEKEQLRKSIIKFWNVKYVPVSAVRQTEEAAKEQESGVPEGQESAGARQRDAEKEAAENACESGAQQGAAGQGRDRVFNAATGSYSGTYGQGEVSEVTRGQIDQILREKKDVIRELVESAGNI